jgi:hypothetical protein
MRHAWTEGSQERSVVPYMFIARSALEGRSIAGFRRNPHVLDGAPLEHACRVNFPLEAGRGNVDPATWRTSRSQLPQSQPYTSADPGISFERSVATSRDKNRFAGPCFEPCPVEFLIRPERMRRLQVCICLVLRAACFGRPE